MLRGTRRGRYVTVRRKPQQTVYVLSEYWSDGGWVHGVYRTRKSAETAAVRSSRVKVGPWVEDSVFKGQWEADINGVGYYKIDQEVLR